MGQGMRRIAVVVFLFLLGWPASAAAEVQIHFYSKDFGSTFPHGFVRLTGTVDSTREAVDTNYGFTPVQIGPGILAGPVRGMIQTVKPEYVARSIRHFSLALTEEQYRTVLAVIEQWRTTPQPSYRLNGRNCVDFVAAMATTLGLRAAPDPKLMKKPKSFLQKVTRDNATLIAQWRAPLSAAAQKADVPSASVRSH